MSRKVNFTIIQDLKGPTLRSPSSDFILSYISAKSKGNDLVIWLVFPFHIWMCRLSDNFHAPPVKIVVSFLCIFILKFSKIIQKRDAVRLFPYFNTGAPVQCHILLHLNCPHQISACEPPETTETGKWRKRMEITSQKRIWWFWLFKGQFNSKNC